MGFAGALSEITLVLFTTLAPSGTMAFIAISFIMLFGKVEEPNRTRLARNMRIPLLAVLVGLVASATHLGNPANALYVVTGIGESPLSNEVAAAVVFIGFAAVCWLYAFADKPKLLFQRLLFGATIIAGLVFIQAIALAYSVETIISWNTPVVPLMLWLNALTAGPLLALLCFDISLNCLKPNRVKWLIGIAGVAFLVSVIIYVVQGLQMVDLHNRLVSAYDLVPHYGLFVGLFAVCEGIALISGLYLFLSNRSATLTKRSRVFALSSVVAVSLVGIFIMRFVFYALHMTTGVAF